MAADRRREREPLPLDRVLTLWSDFAGVEALSPSETAPFLPPQPASPGEAAPTINEAAALI